MRSALVVLVLAGTAAAQPPPEVVSEGHHWRLSTDHGPVHVWRPIAAKGARGGIVVYVHGYYTNVDEAFAMHKLADQFAASERDALFIVPEAPVSTDDEVAWPALGDLLRAVAAGGIELPHGPLVVVGHSAAYRTIAGWLDYEPLREIVLLDSLFGYDEAFLGWLGAVRGHATHRLTLVTSDTARFADAFLRRLPDARSLPAVPDDWTAVAAEDRDARVLELRPGLAHMDIVTGGKVLAPLLERTRVPAVHR